LTWLAAGLAALLAIILCAALVVAGDVRTYRDLQRRLREEKRRMRAR
jgi:hypothetical protein